MSDFYKVDPSTTDPDPNVVKQSVTGANTSCYGTGGFGQYCFNRLPCGICMRTNAICPIGRSNTDPYPYPITVTYSDGTTVMENPYVTTGETTGGINNGK